MFFKMKSREHKYFYEMFEKVSSETQVKIYIWLSLYGFIKVTINDKIISPLSKIVTISEEIQDIIYYFTFGKMKFSNFQNYKLNIGEGDLLFKALGTTAILERNNNTRNPKKNMDIIIPDIDDNEFISFKQMMSKIYYKIGKEFTDEEYIKYTDIFNEYKFLINDFFEGTYIGIKRSEIETIVKRARENLYTFSEFEIFAFSTAITMSLLQNKK